MSRMVPLSIRLCQHVSLVEVARVVGYAGFPASDLDRRKQPRVEEIGHEKVKRAFIHLTKYSSVTPKKDIELRPEVRKVCWQLLASRLVHPWFDLWKKPEPLPNSWDRPKELPAEESKPEKPNRARNRKSASIILAQAPPPARRGGRFLATVLQQLTLKTVGFVGEYARRGMA